MTNYDKYREEYDNSLDESGSISDSGEFKIGSFTKLPSQILYELDEELYRAGLQEYVEQKKEEYKETVYQIFPAPIAYFYRQTEHSYDNENHRLQLLRSTWESLIYVLYGLVLGEVNSKRFSLTNVRVFNNQQIRPDHGGLMSDKLGWKVKAMQKIIEYDQQNNNELLVSSYIKSDTFEVIKELIQERNSFSHIYALSAQEAQSRFDELYPIVSELLFELDFLENVSLLRYVNNLGDVRKIRFNKFDGHSLQKQNYDKTLSDSELLQLTPILNDQIILLELDNLIFNISPFIHFHSEGSHLKLCYFKKIDSSSGNYVFELIAGTEREIAINTSGLSNFINISLGGLL